MKAIAVVPGRKSSVHLAELPKPSLSEVPEGRGVLVRVLRVGVDGTDREIDDAEYGAPPAGSSFLVLGHEGFGRVVLTHRVSGLERYEELFATLRNPDGAIKIYCEVAPL
jgi:threonine dehydrogenase-like Zn-dependent dehydrogenase